MIGLEKSMPAPLRNFGLTVGATARAWLETRIRERAGGNMMIHAATKEGAAPWGQLDTFAQPIRRADISAGTTNAEKVNLRGALPRLQRSC